jgi:hypothetical protein
MTKACEAQEALIEKMSEDIDELKAKLKILDEKE